MIDTGSSADILYFDAFQKLELSANDLTPMTSSLPRFTSDSISLLEIMSLHVTFGDEPCSKTMINKFMVVDIYVQHDRANRSSIAWRSGHPTATSALDEEDRMLDLHRRIRHGGRNARSLPQLKTWRLGRLRKGRNAQPPSSCEAWS
ncbi:hypothetical protein B296_00025919 [Ensete ventricosum]|uniref:Uncharacterized protein n=1 Tax=Ensete ventricosum TaxID=4639 RepID=A0A427ASF0_ENSVE|nr:hypothetical protein B296_00025919 [Ensete ventricosum]